MTNCVYFQAQVKRADTWYLTATLRSFEHLVFDRTIDKKNGQFEFFVPHELKHYFLDVMDYFLAQEIVSNLIELPNRLAQPDSVV